MSVYKLREELLQLTKPYISRADQVQGPGGNTSVKDEEGRMIIKASGFRFDEVTDAQGFSIVNNDEIRKYFHTVQVHDKEKEEKASVDLILANILKDENGQLYPKPSMETGFHSVLNKYVVHTHSVWSNLVNCIAAHDELLEKLKKRLGISIAVIPYISPGFGLSYLVTNIVKQANANHGEVPPVLFLLNHGIIAHSDNGPQVIDLLEKVDSEIRKMLGIKENFPKTDILEESPKCYVPESNYVGEMIRKNAVDVHFFDRVLFPDQTVFFKDNISIDEHDSDKKIQVETNGRISYHTNLREARSMHETMTAYFFIYEHIRRSTGQPVFIAEKELDYINAMDMEKHRKSFME